MSKFIAMIKSLRLKDYIILFFLFFVLTALVTFMIWFLGREVTPIQTSNAYIDCLKERNEKNKYDVKSGLYDRSNFDSFFLSGEPDTFYLYNRSNTLQDDYLLCSGMYEKAYRDHVDRRGIKYPRVNTNQEFIYE
tara:strand:+ start:280 stop:684 length:405 start_codon:yes stop_codon:yes gene_type:complete